MRNIEYKTNEIPSHHQHIPPSQQTFTKSMPTNINADLHRTYNPSIVDIEFSPVAILKQKYDYLVSTLKETNQNSKISKAKNIPKFFIKIFQEHAHTNLSQKHKLRLQNFFKHLSTSITRFDIAQLFGVSSDSCINAQNSVNRSILKRVLVKNYQNILRNNHIRYKKKYLLFCKKMILRLNHPMLIDRLQI